MYSNVLSYSHGRKFIVSVLNAMFYVPDTEGGLLYLYVLQGFKLQSRKEVYCTCMYCNVLSYSHGGWFIVPTNIAMFQVTVMGEFCCTCMFCNVSSYSHKGRFIVPVCIAMF